MTCLPRTVRKALDVLTGIVNKEQVYCPSSDNETSVTLMVNSCHEARSSSILLSLKAVNKKYRNIYIYLYIFINKCSKFYILFDSFNLELEDYPMNSIV